MNQKFRGWVTSGFVMLALTTGAVMVPFACTETPVGSLLNKDIESISIEDITVYDIIKLGSSGEFVGRKA